MSAPQGSAAAVSSWKCAELSAGAQLGRSDLREHFYKSCSEFWEDPRSGSSSYRVTWYISAPFALRSGVQSFLLKRLRIAIRFILSLINICARSAFALASASMFALQIPCRFKSGLRHHFCWRSTQVWLKGPVLKTGRSCKRRRGSNPFFSAT